MDWHDCHITFRWTDQHVAIPAHTISYGPACCHITFGWTDRHVAIPAHTITYGPACCHITFRWTDWHVANPAHTLTYGPACCHIMFGWTDRLVAISAHTWSSSVQAALTYYVPGAPGAVTLSGKHLEHWHSGSPDPLRARCS